MQERKPPRVAHPITCPITGKPIENPVLFNHPKLAGLIYDRRSVLSLMRHNKLSRFGINPGNINEFLLPDALTQALLEIIANHNGLATQALLDELAPDVIHYQFPSSSSALCTADGRLYDQTSLHTILQETGQSPFNRQTIQGTSDIIQHPFIVPLQNSLQNGIKSIDLHQCYQGFKQSKPRQLYPPATEISKTVNMTTVLITYLTWGRFTEQVHFILNQAIQPTKPGNIGILTGFCTIPMAHSHGQLFKNYALYRYHPSRRSLFKELVSRLPSISALIAIMSFSSINWLDKRSELVYTSLTSAYQPYVIAVNSLHAGVILDFCYTERKQILDDCKLLTEGPLTTKKSLSIGLFALTLGSAAVEVADESIRCYNQEGLSLSCLANLILIPYYLGIGYCQYKSMSNSLHLDNSQTKQTIEKPKIGEKFFMRLYSLLLVMSYTYYLYHRFGFSSPRFYTKPVFLLGKLTCPDALTFSTQRFFNRPADDAIAFDASSLATDTQNEEKQSDSNIKFE